MKNKIKFITITLLCGFITIFVLYAISVKEILFSKNGVERNFITKNIKLKDKYFINQNASEIIGIKKKEIYLVNENRTDVFIFNFDTGKSRSLNYNSFLKQRGLLLLHQVNIDDNNLIILSPRKHKIYITNINDISEFKKYDSISIKYGIDGLGYSKTAYFLKGRDSLFNAAYYSLKKSPNSKLIKKGAIMVENTREGIVIDDGFFSNSDDWSIYSKFHKNEFFIINEDGEIEGKKITIAKKKSSPRINKSEKGTVTLMGQVNYKNLRGAINKDNFYLQSGVKADNENPFRFKFNSVIDVYSLKEDEKYVYSFYIPSYAGVKTNSFKIRNNEIFALHGNYLLIYNIHNE